MRLSRMIVSLWLGLSLTGATASLADDPVDVDDPSEEPAGLQWKEAFSSISAVDAKDKLVLVAISNDDPTPGVGGGSPVEAKRENGATRRSLWCTAVLSRSLRKAYEQRPELRQHLVLQTLAAGMPPTLTGGEQRNVPARAVIAICDGNYRLLSMTVGVPDRDDLMTLIEDAEDTRLLMQLHAESRPKLIAALSQRSGQRLRRQWRAALEEMMVAIGDGDFRQDADVPGAIELRTVGRLEFMFDTYQPYYLADVKLRFGLSTAADRRRLIILEQHTEARSPWTEAVVPFVSSDDFTVLWKPMCELLWGAPAIRADAKDEDLLAWWDSQHPTSSIVFSVTPTLKERQQPWPPTNGDGKAAKRGLGWNDLQELAVRHPYRAVDAEQLYVLIRDRGLEPVDLQQPARARYLYYEARQESGLEMREGDPPGRYISILKRDRR